LSMYSFSYVLLPKTPKPQLNRCLIVIINMFKELMAMKASD